MKNILLALAIFSALQAVNAQSSVNTKTLSDSSVSKALAISNIFVFYRAAPLPSAPIDSATMAKLRSAKRSVEVNISFTLSAPSQASQVNFNLGTSAGLSDITAVQYTYVNKNGRDYLSNQNQLYPIINGQVSVSAYITADLIAKPSYASLKAVDTKGNYSNALSQNIQ